jgi:hypothetical protein
LGNDLVLVRQINALIIVQVSTAYLLVVEGEEFVKFILQLFGVVQRNARIANARNDFNLALRSDRDLVTKSGPE